MGEDLPIELRPKFNFHIYNEKTGEILETLWDIQYSYAMDRLTEVNDQSVAGDSTVVYDITRIPGELSPEEVTYTNVSVLFDLFGGLGV
jgi:hypothetical protein